MSSTKKPAMNQKMPNRIQPATGESLEINHQFGSDPQPMNMTQQLSGLFQHINSNKQM